MPPRCATCGCFWKAGIKTWLDELRARMEAASANMRFEEAAALRDLAHHRGRNGRKAEDGGGRRQRHRHLRLLCRASAGGREPVPPAQRPHRRPPRIFLGRPARVRSRGVLFVAAEAGVSGRAIHSRAYPRAGGFRGSRGRWRSCCRERRGRKVEIHTPQRGQKKAMLALVETNAQHSFRAALPRDEAVVEGDRRQRCRMRWVWKAARSASNASTSRTFRAPTKSPAWWCGKTGR